MTTSERNRRDIRLFTAPSASRIAWMSARRANSVRPPRGAETVLLVEDEDSVRRVVKITLESMGYRVLEGRNGPQALEAARGFAGTIHLVLTDVVMPEMTGYELAERFSRDHPGVRILLMSGYLNDAIARDGIARSGFAFLEKPFSPLALARKVREVLDEAEPGEPGALGS